jgi:glycerol uptake facilitator-like aquaporin
MTYSLPQRLAAEGLGTGLLVATVVGSGIMAENLAGGNVAIALLGNTLPTGAILIVLIMVFGPISGAHFNPAVSLIMAIRREMSVNALPLYVFAQVIGGCAGTLAAHLMFELPLLQLGEKTRTGGSQWFAEGLATFGLLVTILGVSRFRPNAVPVAVGLYITAAYWLTASTSFANPAVTIARAFTTSFSGIASVDVPMFILAQLVGALTALALMAWLLDQGSRPLSAARSDQSSA